MMPRALLLAPLLCAEVAGLDASALLRAHPLARGAALRIASDLTGGLPLEVWKTQVAAANNGTALEALRALGRRPGGARNLWTGWPARCIEGACSGALLVAGRDCAASLLRANPAIYAHCPRVLEQVVRGAAGGAAQALAMGPCTCVLTAATLGAAGGAGAGGEGVARVALRLLATGGLFVGTGAVAARQMTNWASRQGLTELCRGPLGLASAGVAGEIAAGVLGGVGSCWNTPLETARVAMQREAAERAREAKGALLPKPPTIGETLAKLYHERGVPGLFRGVTPRAIQAAWQTLWMVAIPNMLGV